MATYTVTVSEYALFTTGSFMLAARKVSQDGGGTIAISETLAGVTLRVPGTFLYNNTVIQGLGEPRSIIRVTNSDPNKFCLYGNVRMENVELHEDSELELKLNSGALTLDDVVVNGRITMKSGSSLTVESATFAAGASIVLDEWKGSTAGALVGLENAVFENSPSVYLLTLGGDTTLAGLSDLRVEYVLAVGAISSEGVIPSGVTLTLGDGAKLNGASMILSASSGTLNCEKGSLITGTLTLEAGTPITGEMTVASGACIKGALTVHEGTVIEFQEGAVLSANVTVEAGGVLRLNGAYVEGTITLLPGARLEGDGAVFSQEHPIVLKNWTGDTAESFSGLSNIKVTHTNASILVDVLSGDAALRSLAGGEYLRYCLGDDVDYGKTLVLGENAILDCNGKTVFGTFDCEDGAYLAGALIIGPAGGYFKHATFKATEDFDISFVPGARRENNGEVMCYAYVVSNTAASGDGSLAQAVWYEATSQGGGGTDGREYVPYFINFSSSLAGETINVPATLYSDISNPYTRITLQEGMMLTFAASTLFCKGTIIASYQMTTCALSAKSLRMSSGGVIDFSNAGIELEGELGLDANSSVTLKGSSLTVGSLGMSGATLLLEQVQANLGDNVVAKGESVVMVSDSRLLVDTITLNDQSTMALMDVEVMGRVVLEEDSKLGASGVQFWRQVDCCSGLARLQNCSLARELLLSSSASIPYMENVVFQGSDTLWLTSSFSGSTSELWASDWYTTTQEKSYIVLESLGTSTLTQPPAGIDYRAASLLTIEYGKETTLEDGVGIDLYGGKMLVKGTLVSNNTSVADSIYDSTSASGQKVSVACGAEVNLTNSNVLLNQEGGKLFLEYGGDFYMTGGTLSVEDSVVVDADLVELEDEAVSLESYLQLNDVHLTSPNIDEQSGEGTGVHMLVNANAQILNSTVAPKSTIEVNSKYVELKIGVIIHSGYLGAAFDAQETSFGAGTTVTVDENCAVQLWQCRFEEGSQGSKINIAEGSYFVNIRGCDLSGVSKINIGGAPSGATKINLNGNYWGTTDIDEIKSRISGLSWVYVDFDADQILTAPPALWADNTAPSLTVNQTQSVRLGDNSSQVTFSWNAQNAVSYVLTVDGEAHTLTETSKTLTLEDGPHSWSVVALSAGGKSTTVSGADFATDTIAPVVVPDMLQYGELVGNSLQMIFSWTSSEAATYVLTVNQETYVLKETTKMLLLPDGDYDWSVTATDEAGNSSIVAGESFSLELAAPTLSVNKEQSVRLGDNSSQVTLSWNAQGATIYVLTVDGVAHTLTGTSKTLTLEDGPHSWSVTAVYASGATITEAGADFTTDTIAPVVTPNAPQLGEPADGAVQVTFSWASSEAASYVLKVGADSFTLTETTKTLTLKEGEYAWSVTATDAAGNSSVVAGSAFTVAGETAPEQPSSFTVTLAEGTAETVGSLAWALAQAAAYIGSEIPSISFDAALDGTLCAVSGEVVIGQTVNVLHEGKLLGVFFSNGLRVEDGGHLNFTSPTFLAGAVQMSGGVLSLACGSYLSANVQVAAGATLRLYDAIEGYSEIGGQVELAAGARLETGFVVVKAGAALTLNDGAYLTGADGFEPTFYVETDETASGSLSITGADLNGTSIYGDGNLTLTNCCGEATLFIPKECRAEFIRITGCDMSQVTITQVGTSEGSETLVDLSGNYWGTTNLDEIKAMIPGYDESRYVIGEVLAESPAQPDTTAPVLSQLVASSQKLAEGSTSVSFSWASSEVATYELTVDGTTYTLSETSKTLTLADGAHRWSVRAVDAVGNTSAVVAGEAFTLDATAPALSLLEPQVESLGYGLASVTFRWVSSEAATYELTVADETYTLTGTSTTLALEEGWYSWSVKATDAAGNTSTVQERFYCEAAAIDVATPILQASGKGKTKATLSWVAEPGLSYELVVDGKTVLKKGNKSQWTGSVKDGVHTYTLTARSAWGETLTAQGSFETDATAPTVRLGNASFAKTGEGRADVTLRWAGEAGATYKVAVDGRLVYTGAEESCTLSLSLWDEKHTYTVTATDAAGNTSKAVKGKFTVDVTAPVVTLKSVKTKKTAAGVSNVTLSWKGESKAVYTLVVDGKELYSGTKTSFSLEFADGVHDYIIYATDAAGNTSEKTGHFVTDATAPAVELEKPELLCTESGTQATFSWSGEAGASYTLKVDGKKYTTTGTSLTLTLKNGKHTYSLVAKDAAGNSSTELSAAFYAAPNAVVLNLSPIGFNKTGEGRGNILLDWAGLAGMEYIASVDGRDFEGYMGYEPNCALSVNADGKYTYEINAWDFTGTGHDSSTLTGKFTVDATAPKLTLNAPKLKANVNGKDEYTFSWKGESKAVYTLVVDGELYYTGTKTKFTLRTSESGGSYSVTATDAAGNSTTQSGSFGSGARAVAHSTLDAELALSAGELVPQDACELACSTLCATALEAQALSAQEKTSLLASLS